MAGATQINSYVEGNRVIVTATCKVLPSGALTTPSTWELFVRNSRTNEILHFASVDNVLPLGVNASMANPSEGVINFTFDIDEHGERRVYFAGTGACKCAGKIRFMVEGRDA